MLTIAIDFDNWKLFTLSLFSAQNSRLFVLSRGKHDSAYIKDKWYKEYVQKTPYDTESTCSADKAGFGRKQNKIGI